MNKAIRFWLFVGVFFACHLATIRVPSANNDESIVVSHALNGRVAFYDLVRPKNLPYEYMYHALLPAYEWVLRQFVHWGGVSVVMVRLPTCLIGLVNVGLLIYPFFKTDFRERYRAQRLVIGPSALSLFEPHVPIQNPDLLIGLKERGFRVNLAKAFWACHPSMILLHPKAAQQLERDAARAGFGFRRIRTHLFQPLTDNDYDEVELFLKDKS